MKGLATIFGVLLMLFGGGCTLFFLIVAGAAEHSNGNLLAFFMPSSWNEFVNFLQIGSFTLFPSLLGIAMVIYGQRK
jgi:hypothetical protein